jgi:lanthanide-dependent methanol dehydrogenase
VANAEVDPRVRNGALGFTGATQDLPFYTAGGSELLVFKLGGANGEDTSHAPSK